MDRLHKNSLPLMVRTETGRARGEKLSLPMPAAGRRGRASGAHCDTATALHFQTLRTHDLTHYPMSTGEYPRPGRPHFRPISTDAQTRRTAADGWPGSLNLRVLGSIPRRLTKIPNEISNQAILRRVDLAGVRKQLCNARRRSV